MQRAGFVLLPNIPAVDTKLARWILIKSALLFSFFFSLSFLGLGRRPIEFFMAFFIGICYELLWQLARLTSIYMIEWLRKRKFRQLYLLGGSISIHFASNRMGLYGRLNWFYSLNKNKWVYVLTINAFSRDEISDRLNKTSEDTTYGIDSCLYATIQYV